jgi:Protein of unknown function (DUF1559)
MRSEDRLLRGLLLSILLLAMVARAAPAYSNRSVCQNNLCQLYWALKAYHKEYGVLPTDIYDNQGHALLSWRVRLLPYLDETTIYEQFHLNEPWDSAHNNRLVEKLPPIYRCPSSQARMGVTPYVRLLGSMQVLLVEVDDDHAVVWSKPGDVNYDPMTPTAGLAGYHFSDSLGRPGGFVLFSDGKTRFVPAGIDPGLLRAFLSAGRSEAVDLGFPWYRALFTRPIGFIMGPWLLISSCGAIGVSRVVPRLLKRLPVSPGEMLWLVAGAAQLAHLVAVVTCYRYEPFATLGGDQWFPFWFVPSLVATLTAIVPAVWYFSFAGWRTLFITTVLLLAASTLDAGAPHQHRSPDESFLTAGSPVLLASLAAAAAAMTLSTKEPSAWTGRRLAHWAGIVVCLVPFVFFAICIACGVAYPREMFFRCLD